MLKLIVAVLALSLPVLILSTASAATLKFAMIGDIHCNADTKNIISKIDMNPGLAGVIILGDMTYHSMAPGCIEDMTKHWKSSPTFRCVMGNHDMQFITFYDDYCNGGGQYWRRTITSTNGVPLTLLGINTEIPLTKGSAQYNWFNGFIKAQSDSNSIILWIGHTPCSGPAFPSKNMSQWVRDCTDLLNANNNNNKLKIDAYISGHQHCMAYSAGKAIAGTGGASPKDSIYLSCSDGDGGWWTQTKVSGYLLVTVDTATKKITYEFKDKNNIVLKKVSFS
jgi:predicted phosphodiesterase